MQAITTKYLGPTDTRGASVVARCQGKKIAVAWDHAIGSDENHELAALQLAHKLGCMVVDCLTVQVMCTCVL